MGNIYDLDIERSTREVIQNMVSTTINSDNWKVTPVFLLGEELSTHAEDHHNLSD